MKKMGIYLRQKRELKGFTQAQVAIKLGFGSPQFISNIERGVSRVPLKSLRAFIELYEIPKEEIIEILMDEKRAHLKKTLGIE
jgi:transcriptional regulator with XRE-family HTH domain